MEWASLDEPPPEPIHPGRLLKKIKFMNATLPSKAIDEDAGEQRTAVYVAILSQYAEDAISWMVQQACARLDWFPTPKQCLALIEEYEGKRPPTERTLALVDGRKFLEQRLAEFMATFRDGTATASSIAAVPEHWRRVAMEQGFLRYDRDGGYSIRAQRVASES